MRALVLASIAIAALLALLASDGRKAIVPANSPAMPANASAMTMASGARIVQAARVLPTPSVAPTKAVHSIAASRAASAKPAASVATLAKPVDPVSAYGVHRFTPGSKRHAEAIASTLASSDVQAVAAPVARLYFASLNRAPDYEGLNYYIDERNAGEPLAAIADEFAGSVEFDGRYGELDNAAFVDRIHLNIAAGPADAALRAHWIAQLDSGAMTRGDLMVALSESTQFRSLTANPVFVTMAYAETLGRAPSPAELERWVAYLDAGRPRDEMIQGLLGRRPPR